MRRARRLNTRFASLQKWLQTENGNCRSYTGIKAVSFGEVRHKKYKGRSRGDDGLKSVRWVSNLKTESLLIKRAGNTLGPFIFTRRNRVLIY